MKRMMIAALLLQLAGLAAAQTFTCGGIGKDDSDRMKAEAAKHDMLVTFSATGGAYLADIDFQIRKGSQVVAQGKCAGPLMLVDLSPKGSYEISATSNGKTQKKTVNVGGKPANVSFVW